LREFAQRRLAGRGVEWLDSLNVYERFDCVVAVDTLEHIHPDEIGGVLYRIGRLLTKHGTLYAHNNWTQQDAYPMHHDNSAAFAAWCEAEGLTKVGENRWERR
jgi:cyclopropane fatty-acyl-phospholipid synthase-like methyltransferase